MLYQEIKSQSHPVPELPGKSSESVVDYGDLAVSTLDRKLLLLRRELYEERSRLGKAGTCTRLTILDRVLHELHRLLWLNVSDVQPREDISPRSYAAAQGLSTNHSGRMQSSNQSEPSSCLYEQSQNAQVAAHYKVDTPTR